MHVTCNGNNYRRPELGKLVRYFLLCGLRVQILRQNIWIIWHPYCWDLGKILHLYISRTSCLKWNDSVFLLGNFEDWLVKPFNMYKQYLTLNKLLVDATSWRKNTIKPPPPFFFSHTAGGSGDTIEVKWKKINKLVPELHCMIILSNSFFKKTCKMSYSLWKKRSLKRKALWI